MRHHPNLRAERCRIRYGPLASDSSDGVSGAYLVEVGRETLIVIVSDGLGWDHVSVSLRHRCPTWEEMQAVRRLFFADEEWVVQYSPPVAQHINVHPYCLHMWRPQGVDLPTPPPDLVAPITPLQSAE